MAAHDQKSETVLQGANVDWRKATQGGVMVYVHLSLALCSYKIC